MNETRREFDLISLGRMGGNLALQAMEKGILGYRNPLSFLIVLFLLTSNNVQAASFDYGHYESILNRYVKSDGLVKSQISPLLSFRT